MCVYFGGGGGVLEEFLEFFYKTPNKKHVCMYVCMYLCDPGTHV